MPLALPIKIKIVGKFQSLTTVKCKLKAEFGKQIPSLYCINDVLLKLEQWKIGKTFDYYTRDSRKAERRKSVRRVAVACEHSASNYERTFIDKTIQGTFCSTVRRRRFSRSDGQP